MVRFDVVFVILCGRLCGLKDIFKDWEGASPEVQLVPPEATSSIMKGTHCPSCPGWDGMGETYRCQLLRNADPEVFSKTLDSGQRLSVKVVYLVRDGPAHLYTEITFTPFLRKVATNDGVVQAIMIDSVIDPSSNAGR